MTDEERCRFRGRIVALEADVGRLRVGWSAVGSALLCGKGRIDSVDPDAIASGIKGLYARLQASQAEIEHLQILNRDLLQVCKRLVVSLASEYEDVLPCTGMEEDLQILKDAKAVIAQAAKEA